jgi:hypothetical protein
MGAWPRGRSWKDRKVEMWNQINNETWCMGERNKTEEYCGRSGNLRLGVGPYLETSDLDHLVLVDAWAHGAGRELRSIVVEGLGINETFLFLLFLIRNQ